MANHLNYKKLARPEEWPTLSSNPFVMAQPGQRFSVGTLRAFHWTKIPVWNFGKTTCPVEGTFQLQTPTKGTAILVIVLVSRIQIIGPGENNFVKWKETFRSDRLDQIRSVLIKVSVTPQNVILTQNVIRIVAKCNTNAKCNNTDAKCNKIFNAECNNISTQIVIYRFSQG